MCRNECHSIFRLRTHVATIAQRAPSQALSSEPKNTQRRYGTAVITRVHTKCTINQYFVNISVSTHQTEPKLESHVCAILIYLWLKARDRPFVFLPSNAMYAKTFRPIKTGIKHAIHEARVTSLCSPSLTLQECQIKISDI
jgi:hypothetical protein